MGANSKQGWYLLLFLIGFTFLPAGLAYLGYFFALVGLACLIVSLIGFYQIRPLEFEGAETQSVSVAPTGSGSPTKHAV